MTKQRRAKYRRASRMYNHREATESHARSRFLQRYPWALVDDYYKVRRAVERAIEDDAAERMWGYGTFCVEFLGHEYYVRYDFDLRMIKTWFPMTDPRVQEWVLEHRGVEAARALHETNGRREELV